ncbi:prepilin-type N-terminal cleavage/methylation domain-containing protein [Halobacillus sp. ACCC02827]|uniref:type IV pilus modification PilV family protein n=1 Tax=Bacillaceae TaxID=186817 RepID=UPI0002A50D7E|nr:MULTISPECIES: prepilin-type N-terminal cleavage/methylation domain-containing protein [Bacillaceae]ELK48103.1 hypothetical protein D479_04298 [Halobacillus sp. BAB-2008]QHT45596.1 type II secretion system protein [Bacillus sp. SB49]WJE16391.1 prepilin-type N-terminal cleavage/methylation domain-containing protein [Halobacillus sp. ACCC02827]
MKWKALQSERGVTLLEIVVSMTILFIVLIVAFPLFTQSQRSSSVSSNMLDATYIAQKKMEDVYHLSTSIPFQQVETALAPMKRMAETEKTLQMEEAADGYYIELTLTKPDGGLSTIIVKVFQNSDKQDLEAQMETIYRWETEA